MISIHALLAESDRGIGRQQKDYIIISIHALLAESDDDILAGVNELLISIHALLAESDSILDYFSGVMRQFLSTLSLRRATYVRSYRPNFSRISIHALLAESDSTSL